MKITLRNHRGIEQQFSTEDHNNIALFLEGKVGTILQYGEENNAENQLEIKF